MDLVLLLAMREVHLDRDGQGPRCGTATEHDAPVAQSELGRVRHGQRDGLGRCSCTTPPRDKAGAATSDSGAQGVSV